MRVVRGGGESGEVGDHAAAQRHDDVGPGQAVAANPR